MPPFTLDSSAARATKWLSMDLSMYVTDLETTPLPNKSIIAFTRLYLYVHFPTDVLCGAICGTVFGGISYYFSKKILGVLGEKREAVKNNSEEVL